MTRQDMFLIPFTAMEPLLRRFLRGETPLEHWRLEYDGIPADLLDWMRSLRDPVDGPTFGETVRPPGEIGPIAPSEKSRSLWQRLRGR